MPLDNTILVYTDGSCHTQHCIGSWVAILFIDHKKIILSGTVEKTTHQRMELTAVIHALDYIKQNAGSNTVQVITDSQYVTGLPGRESKLTAAGFCSKKGRPIQNADLVKRFLEQLTDLSVALIKIKSHQKEHTLHISYNTEADTLARTLVREAVLQLVSHDNSMA